jgi:hypothetical protein
MVRPPLRVPAEPLVVLTYKWRPRPGYRSKFTSEHVNTLARMVARHYRYPHVFTCVTDDPAGLDPTVRAIPLWEDHAGLKNPSSPERGPSCYRRLRMFAADAGEWLGARVACLDLDCVVVDDLTPLFHRSEDFVIWSDTNPTTPYNGSLVLFTAGARPQLWDDFDPATSPRLTREAKLFGSDQAWISYRLGRGEATFKRVDGVCSYRVHLKQQGLHRVLPPGTRLVQFHGDVDPWSPEAQRLPWVREHYR